MGKHRSRDGIDTGGFMALRARNPDPSIAEMGVE
jgi:hypothetical protein